MRAPHAPGRLPGRMHFRIGIQRTRAAAYLIALGVALVFRWLGVLDARYDQMFALIGGALATCAACYWLVVEGHAERLGAGFEALWMLSDAALISWAIALTGGLESPWFPWYLANIAAAAFVAGELGAFAVAVLDTTAYVGTLAVLGHIHGFDRNLYEPLARMAFLYGASFLFLRGVSLLRDRQRLVKRMRDEEARKVEELTRLAAALDERTRELGEANLRIREADRLKSQFLATMSHELRTPLNSIIGFSDVLIARPPHGVPERYLKFLHNINSSGQHLLRIINDLLDLSKIEAGKMELSIELVPVPKVVRGVVTVAQGMAKSRGISLTTNLEDDLPTVEADAVKLKQILFNLVSNAVKFSDDQATVSISARRLAGEDGGDRVELAVRDWGVGIDPKDHRVIFEEFRQVDATTTRPFGGTGLGLALVKRLVELHHGTISVDSAPGVGSTFTVHLPVRFSGDPSLVEPSPETLELPSEGGTRVLVVEDEPTAFESISRVLLDAAYIPVRARNADEALRLTRVLKPAAITLDIILPGTDGWEILKALKRDPATRTIPVIIVSVLDNRELALTLGAADCFTKPIDGDTLVARLTELLPSRPSHRPRVLLIDDDPDLHDLLDAKLSPRGYELSHALDGATGLGLAAHTQPGLILLDLMMEEMDGFEVATRLKAEPTTAHIPVVVLTAKDMSAEERQRLRGKIEALVQKANTPVGDLAAVIESILIRQQTEENSVKA